MAVPLDTAERAYLEPYLPVSPAVSLLTSPGIDARGRAGAIQWLDEASKRLPSQLIRTVVQPRTDQMQRSASKVVRGRRRVFWDRYHGAAAGKVEGVEERLAEEVSLRSLRLQDPGLFERMMGSLKMCEMEEDEPGRVEGLPPADGDASGEGAERRGAAFTRYLKKIDLEEAEIRLDAQRGTEAEEEDEDDDDDQDGEQQQSAQDRARGGVQRSAHPGSDTGKQEFLSIMAERFVQAASDHFSRELYDVVDFEDAFDPPVTTMLDEDSYWNIDNDDDDGDTDDA